MSSQGMDVYFEIEGTGPPLVLMHGWSDSLEGWRELGYVDLLKERHRLVLIDARGHGRSEKPHDPEAYDLRHQVADVTAVLDALAIPRAGYYGYSMGGRIGLRLLRDAPERLDSLVVGGASPYAASSRFFRDALSGGLEEWIALVERHAGRSMSSPTRRRLLDNDVEALRAAVARDAPAIFETVPSSSISCRLIVGGSDPIAPLVERCARELPGAELHVLPGLNHFQVIHEAERVVAIGFSGS